MREIGIVHNNLSDRRTERPTLRIFYVLHIPNYEIRACVNTIRLLADPSEKWPAHITVRGPYEQAIECEELNKTLEGNCITIRGLGRFRGAGQRTVFFQCDGTRLGLVWEKKDFPYNPHITLYDGKSEGFADKLEAVARRYEYAVEFESDRLEPMITVKGVRRPDLFLSYDPVFMARILGEYVLTSEIITTSLERRLELIDCVCRHLSSLSVRQSAVG